MATRFVFLCNLCIDCFFPVKPSVFSTAVNRCAHISPSFFFFLFFVILSNIQLKYFEWNLQSFGENVKFNKVIGLISVVRGFFSPRVFVSVASIFTTSDCSRTRAPKSEAPSQWTSYFLGFICFFKQTITLCVLLSQKRVYSWELLIIYCCCGDGDGKLSKYLSF